MSESNILIVDDSNLVLAQLSDVLGSKGYSTFAVTSGEDALKIVGTSPPDLILLDMLMPGMNGFELLERLQRAPLSYSGPIIMITGSNQDEHLARALAAGASDFVSKPFSPVALLARVKAALKSHKLQTKLELARQAAEAATRAKSEFLANMSHEIRTPMTSILGYTDVLIDEIDWRLAPQHHRVAMETIQRNGEYLLELINDILDVAKIEAGKMAVEQIRCAPMQIVADVASLMRVRAERKGLALNVECQGAIPAYILSDPTRLRQILINLVGNAVKFTNQGRVSITVRFGKESAGRPSLYFDISDTGKGMTADELTKLFHPFTQTDPSTTRKFGGTGLGLTICKQLAELLEGTVTVSSIPGVGSIFTVRVATGPLDDVAMLDQPAEIGFNPGKSSHPAAFSERLHCRVLLAEDGPDNQRLISFLLTKAGAEVVIAENGKIAVELALRSQSQGDAFDVILMDMQMPVMDGCEATRELRHAGCKTPIIALTANAMIQDRQKCAEAGCDTFASKPIDRNRLLKLVATFATNGSAHPANCAEHDNVDAFAD
jgi:signal transduction histidine kinase